jgi:ATP synthase protein I
MKPDANGELRREVKKRVHRIERAQRERDSLLAQTTCLGSIAGLFVVPIVGGAYLGRWLDGLQQGYSVRWTVSLIVLGVVIGAVNVYLYLKKND